ncbi:MAG TPA: hypothetical protein EYP78_02260 [Candidatus Omnitrophica bacterium]|nr:hypothetical protein [Candidatus Omnitrophota bacterium]
MLKIAKQARIPYIPGVRTFQDVQDIWEASEEEKLELKVLKICPVIGITPEYINCLSSCYPGITFCPTGTVGIE